MTTLLKQSSALALSAGLAFGTLAEAGEHVLSATLNTSHQVRLWTNNTVNPVLNGTTVYNTFQNSQIGKSGPGDQQRLNNTIHGFQLPTFANGFAGIQEATYSITKTGENTSPSWDAQIYIFSPAVTPQGLNPENAFWSAPEEDARGNVRTVHLNAITPGTANTELGFTLTSTMLSGFYNPDGTPASAGGMIWFRVNSGANPTEVANFQRYEIQSVIGQANSPTLSLTAIPEPGTYALFGGLGALFLVVFTRRYPSSQK